MSTIYLRVVGRSDVGNVRKNNEDAFVVADLTGSALMGPQGSSGRFEVGERGVLLAVSDGMGGLMAGEVASALVLDTLPRAMRSARPSAPTEDVLRAGVQQAHEKVWTMAQREGVRMGATLTAVFVEGNVAWIAEVGDSRAYLVRAGTITQLTKDQSLVQKLLDSGVVSPEDAAHSPYRNVILQAMGQQHDVAVALGRLELRERDCIVLCSDGLTMHLTDDDIRGVLLSSADLDVACERLVNLAKARGGLDNVTVVLAGVDGQLPAPSASSPGETFKVVHSFG